MIALTKELWGGRRPLEEAFWRYAVVYGLLLNLATSLAFFALLARDAAAALIAVAFVVPIPYNVLVTVAVWRSAGRYRGSRNRADLARLGTVIWMVCLTLA